jgi:hypothetical protein
MNRRHFVLSAFACVTKLSGQSAAIQPDLARLRSFNRTAARLTGGPRSGARLSEAPGDGVAYLEGIEFANGTIELDLRGKDIQQLSFLGVAFHGVDGTTYDAVYFRPFNFRADDPERRKRAVQYISHPAYPWQKLRADHPGKYEQTVSPVPDPNAWFHARIVVAAPKVSVFVEGANEPSLIVSQLSARGKGLIGLWAGNNSGGDFANLKVIPA